MTIRASAKSMRLRTVNATLFMAGIEYMRRESSLNAARASTSVSIRKIHVTSARQSHRSYLRFLRFDLST